MAKELEDFYNNLNVNKDSREEIEDWYVNELETLENDNNRKVKYDPRSNDLDDYEDND